MNICGSKWVIRKLRKMMLKVMFNRTLVEEFWQGFKSKDVCMKVKSQIRRLLWKYKEKLAISKASKNSDQWNYY